MKNILLVVTSILLLTSCKVQEKSLVKSEDIETVSYNDTINFTATIRVMDSPQVDTTCYNFFYVVNTKYDIEIKAGVPCGKDFYESYDKDSYVILDTLEYHPIK
jgi:uncharacterized lipoprotein YajG